MVTERSIRVPTVWGIQVTERLLVTRDQDIHIVLIWVPTGTISSSLLSSRVWVSRIGGQIPKRVCSGDSITVRTTISQGGILTTTGHRRTRMLTCRGMLVVSPTEQMVF